MRDFEILLLDNFSCQCDPCIASAHLPFVLPFLYNPTTSIYAFTILFSKNNFRGFQSQLLTSPHHPELHPLQFVASCTGCEKKIFFSIHCIPLPCSLLEFSPVFSRRMEDKILKLGKFFLYASSQLDFNY